MKPNHQRVTEGLQVLTSVLAPYVMQELRAEYQDGWWSDGVLGVLYENRRQDLPAEGSDEELVDNLDAALCLLLMDLHWHGRFRRKLGREHRTWIKELIGTRNKWAHSGLLDMADEDAWRALDTMTRLVDQMDADAAESLRVLARTVRYGTKGPSTSVRDGVTVPRPDSGPRAGNGMQVTAPRHGLSPWRKVARPHPDVAAGRYRQAEFAADLSQVARGRADAEYQDPVEFFARTYLTEGMRGLLVQALRRVAGQGGEPVIQLKTSFGGGKTHSLLALYHLLRGRVPSERLRGVSALLRDAGIDQPGSARVAVLVGTAINPTRERRPPNLPGITVRTLWGEIAAQLAEQVGNPKQYDSVRTADRRGVPPGSDALRTLFDDCGPCVILIDELVAYARKIYGVDGLPAGSFDAIQTFIQELTEAVRASKNSVLIATIPESDIEIGGEAGRETLDRIEHTFGRMEAIWKPVASEEGFEVVRRRLFLPIDDEQARDEVCRAFSTLYRDSSADFPNECREARYLQRLTACYPIHPEVFERLFNDWATLERFQRTRGVLRLMAAVIHDLWERNDAGPLILPSSFGLDAAAVRDELTRYLPEGWTSVLEGDVDGRNSGPYRIDANNARFGQTVAARRVARTVFLGSAPHVSEQRVRGVEDLRIRLGAVHPSEQIAVLNDALSELSEQLTYLYRKDRRYWYDTRPNLRRTVAERAQQLSKDDVDQEVEHRIRKATLRGRGDFQSVHPCPRSPADVPDEPMVRLVLLIPSKTHVEGEADSLALAAARELLSNRGNRPRQHQNMLVFLAPDRDAMAGLMQETRKYLAWKSVVRDHEALNLDANQRREAAEGEKQSNDAVTHGVAEAWRWLLAPIQHVSDEGVSGLDWIVEQIAGGADGVAARASQRMVSRDLLITRWSPALLKMELDRWFWKGRHSVPAKQVWDALCAYPYLPRLRDQSVFVASIQDGLASVDYFAYATGVSPQDRYVGLAFGAQAAAVYIDATSVLIKPESARSQIESERDSTGQGQSGGGGTVIEHGTGTGQGGTGGGSGHQESEDEARPLRRFFGTTQLDPDRASRDIGTISEEVLQHLITLPNAEVEVSVEISAKVPAGVSPDTKRIIEENCNTLGFRSHGFEEE